MTTPEHLCLSCVWAEWKKRADGKLHPSGFGVCKMPISKVRLPAAFKWYDRSWFGGDVWRTPGNQVYECSYYEKEDSR